MKVSELEGALLDWWVAKAEGHRVRNVDNELIVFYEGGDDTGRKETRGPVFAPSSDWADGGRIIERERILIRPVIPHGNWFANKSKYPEPAHILGKGPTPLIAAMRCFVASKFGEEVK